MKIPTISLVVRPASSQEVERTETVKVASWAIMAITVAVFVARQIMKAIVFRRVALDDLFILLATMFAIGLSITTFILASEGLGLSGSLSLKSANILMKGYYASEFLYISAICLAKLSILVLFHKIVAVQRLYRRFVLGFGVFILAWSISSLVAVAVQCQLPRPWEVMTLRCFNSRAFWIVYCIIDMSTEVSIIMLSINLVAYLRVRFSRKIAVVACFAPRALVIGASLVRLIWLYPITPHSAPQYKLWLPAILTQVHVCVSICTASIPYMVPFFKNLEANLRKTYSAKGRDMRKEESGSRSPLWFRRQRKGKALNSWDSTAAASLQYERVPQASPYLPTPRPMSPLTPPRLQTPPSRSPSERGLSIRIPDRDMQRQGTADIVSPQTASSFALSPTCASPQPLLSRAFIPTRKAPTPPPKTHSPNPQLISPTYPSEDPPLSTTPRGHRFSLFPPQQSSSRSPQPQQGAFASSSVAPIRAMRSQTVSSGSRHPNVSSPYNSPPTSGAYRSRSSSNAQAPKFSTAPQPRSPPPTTTRNTAHQRTTSVQDLTSPMGAAINNYFSSAVASDAALPPLPTPPARSVSNHQRQRNQQILSPYNSTRAASPPGSALHPPTPDDVMRADMFFSRDSIYVTRTSRSHTMPSIRDVRNSPQIVIQSPIQTPK